MSEEQCQNCDGRGQVEFSDEAPMVGCPACGGTGVFVSDPLPAHTHSQLRELLAKATPPPWGNPWDRDSDAYLSIAAVNALPGLLDELEEAKELLSVAVEHVPRYNNATDLYTAIHAYLKGES